MRRQEASRFHANGENPRSDGGGESPPPSPGIGRSREHAARLITGQDSYKRLEQIGDLQRIAGDERTDASLRALAVAELDAIDQGGAVSSAHQRVSAHHSLAELEAIAADLSRPAGVRHASSASAARLHAVERTASAAELEQLAREALARVKAARKSTNGSRRPAPARPTASSDKAKLPVRAFVFLWADLHDWWTQYDVAELAIALTDEQWEQFEETLAGTIAFAESLRALRSGSRAAAR
ncbi:hypothetical protein GCM10009749_29700 [Agromyces neolithicus]|uniref:DUF222 domain-containing protein n=1 Tax=Agromyces neolithicus TaxID=269420 RepID=A0ABN2MBE0_9MICO